VVDDGARPAGDGAIAEGHRVAGVLDRANRAARRAITAPAAKVVARGNEPGDRRTHRLLTQVVLPQR
jgi:hypothetical protein